MASPANKEGYISNEEFQLVDIATPITSVWGTLSQNHRGDWAKI